MWCEADRARARMVIGVANGAQSPTDWQQSGYATQTGPVSTVGAAKNADGSVNIFGNATTAAAALANYQAEFPGPAGPTTRFVETGSRDWISGWASSGRCRGKSRTACSSGSVQCAEPHAVPCADAESLDHECQHCWLLLWIVDESEDEAFRSALRILGRSPQFAGNRREAGVFRRFFS